MSTKKGKTDFQEARAPKALGVFKDSETDWTFSAILGFMQEKACTIGESLFAARRIDTRNTETWINEWASLATKVQAQGEESLRGGHKVSARESFLRASLYYHAAERGCTPSDPRFHELWDRGRKSMQQAFPLFNPPVQVLDIVFEGKKLPAYFWHPDNTATKRPTLFAAGGADSTLEQIFLMDGPASIRRGYNFFTFDYPGHRGAVHLYPDCVRRPDYEIPFKVAFDVLAKLPGVDERIALIGESYGGFVVSRVAISEKRVKALIPNSPLIDIHRQYLAAWSWTLKIPEKLVDQVIKRALRNKPLMQVYRDYLRWVAGIKGDYSRSANLEYVKQYNLTDDVHKIDCPALALVSSTEGELMNQLAREFFEKISSKNKKIYVFTPEADGTYDHCQVDNRVRQSQVMFDWLDELFDYHHETTGL